MNKAFIALCFGQSQPDLPPLGHHIPLTAFYRLVKVTLFIYFEKSVDKLNTVLLIKVFIVLLT